ncbi:MAG TPA: ABC transporter permease [Baekduia sp.]|nr:ABC transporter permease [Baekduia sp.]
MKLLVVFVLLGLGPGALIAGIALGLIVQHRGSGVINLSTGAIATFGAYAYFGLKTEGGVLWVDLGSPMGTGPALVVTIALCVLLGIILDRWIFRPLRTATPLAKLIASLGLLLTFQAVFLLKYGNVGSEPPAVLPNGPGDSVSVFGVPVPLDRFYLTGIVLVAAAALTALYRFSSFGLKTRAAAESEANAMAFGLSPQRLSMANTVLATVLAGMFGVLAAPTTTLDPSTIVFAVVPALGAALLAAFTSFGIAAGVGLLMGIIQSSLIYLQTLSWFPTVGGSQLPGVAPLIFFIVIIIALFLRGASLPTRGTVLEQRLPMAPEARRIVRPALILFAIGLVALFVLPAAYRAALSNSLVGVILCLALVVIVGFVGQASLVHVALAGIAAFAVAKLTEKTGIPFPLAPLLAVWIAMLFGLAAAVPALRVRGVSLAILTLAAAVAIEQFVFNNSTFGQEAGGSTVAAPHIFGLSLGPDADFPGWDGKIPSPVTGLYVLAITTLIAVAVASLRRTTFGRQMLSVRSNEQSAAAAGISVRNVKITAFVISSAIAGVGGVLLAYDLGSVSAQRFGILSALGLIAFAYMGGITTVSGALLGGLLVPGGLSTVATEKWTGLSDQYLYLLGGVTLVYTIIVYPQGLALATENWWRATRARIGRRNNGPTSKVPELHGTGAES